MPARRRHFKRPLSVKLAPNLTKIKHRFPGFTRRQVNPARLRELSLPSEKLRQLLQIFHGINRGPRHQRRLVGICCRHHYLVFPVVHRSRHRRQHPAAPPHRAVEREFAKIDKPGRGLGRHLPRRRQDAGGQREIVTRSLLTDIGRGQVDRNPPERKRKSGIFQRRPHPVARLADSGIWKPHNLKGRQSPADIDFHPHQIPLQAVKRHAFNYRQQLRRLPLISSFNSPQRLRLPPYTPCKATFSTAYQCGILYLNLLMD